MNDLILPVSVAVVVAVLGLPVARWLEETTYRKPDEVDEPSPGRRWWVPIALALGSALVVHRVWQMDDGTLGGWPAQVVLSLTLLVVVLACVCLAAMDLDVHRLPDRIMWPTMGALAGGLVLTALVGGGFEPLLRAVLAGMGSGAFYLLLALLSLARGSLALGLGDVKLAVVLGGALGWFGWGAALVGLYGGFVVGGVTALVLLVGRRVRLKGHFAYGPSMMIGALIGLMIAAPLLDGLF